MFNRSLVIVAVDGAPETERIVRYAVSVAKQRGADLHVIQVVGPRSGPLWRDTESERRLRARISALRPAVEQEGIAVRIVTLRGAPISMIVEYAQLNSANLIVVGRHYSSSRLWRNSRVASRLSRSGPVPVLVVPAAGATEVHPVSRILAAVDFTGASAIALRTAVDLSKRNGAHLTMLHVVKPLDPMAFSGGEASLLIQRLPAELSVLSSRLRRKAMALGSGDAEPVVMTGDAGRGIVETAKTASAHIIVMAVAPRTRVDEIMSPSTLRAVLRRASIPVLVIPVVGEPREWMDEIQKHSIHRSAVAAASVRAAA